MQRSSIGESGPLYLVNGMSGEENQGGLHRRGDSWVGTQKMSRRLQVGQN